MTQDLHLKRPVYRSMTEGIRGRIEDAIQLTGKDLPVEVVAVLGALITVQFAVSSVYTLPVVTVPLFGPEYIRYPIKKGDQGVVMSCDARIDNVSGQGGGVADLNLAANLSSIWFMPLGNANWVKVDPTQVTVYAPNGVLIRDTTSAAKINLLPGSITISLGDSTWTMTKNSVSVTTDTYTVNAPNIVLNGQLSQGQNAGGYPATLQGPLTVISDVTAGGKSLEHHEHSGVQSGSSTSGPPV